MKPPLDQAQVAPIQSKRNRHFVVLTQPRSGSYLLVDLLNQVPGIRCHPEIFKPGRMELDPDIRPLIKRWTVAKRDERPILYMREVLSKVDCHAKGFKMFPEHNARLLDHVTKANYFHKIVLVRHPISRFISRLRAEATGRWVHRKDDSRGLQPEASVNFDVGRFENFLRQHSGFSDTNAVAAATNPNSYTIVDYEEVVSLRALERICPTLGIDEVNKSLISPSLQKQTTESFSKLVSNYEDMKSYFRHKHPALLDQEGCPSLD